MRENATAVRKQYGLSAIELRAVQSGDAHQLVNLGMDSRLVQDATPALTDKARLFLLRMSVVVMAGVVSLFALAPGVQASARTVPRLKRRVGRRVSMRDILGSVRARVSARVSERAGRVQVRHALRRVRARMQPGDTPESDRQLQSDTSLSLQDPIQ